MKREIFFVLMIISMFLISACDVYNTLYVKQVDEGGAVEVSEEDIILEVDEDEDSGLTIDELEDLFGEEDIEIEEVEEIVEEDLEVTLDEEIIEEVVGELEEVEEEFERDVEEEIPEDATVIIIEETEFVNLVPKAEDPDMDVLTFTFTSPLNDNGEWQTTYGDAGEYTITVTVSDGELTTSKEVLIIINRKEEAPVLESFKPGEIAIEIDEMDSISFDVTASDLNDDVLEYSWKLDGIKIGNEDSVEYQTTYDDSGSHTIKVIVSDGVFDTEKIWSVTVNNVNRKPVLAEVDDIEASETDTVVIWLDATDHDGDELSFGIDDERFVQDGSSFIWETTYDDSGEHTVTVTVSDGMDTISQEVKITIENVNRAPVILDIVQKQ